MSNTNQLAATLNQIAALIEAQGITPTKEMVISLSLKTLVDAGYEFRTAFEMIMGEGSYEKLANSVYDQLRAA